jgi:hypothetical protein
MNILPGTITIAHDRSTRLREHAQADRLVRRSRRRSADTNRRLLTVILAALGRG